MRTERELYDIYARWTGELQFYVARELNEHVDAQYFPDNYLFKVYSGWAEESVTSTGLPGLSRPPGERVETIKLLRPEQNPNRVDLDNLFKQICLAAARVLQLNISRAKLQN